jgi:hypothetical protein
MEGGVLGAEMLNHFGCSVTTPSPSAFVQQRAKIGPDMLPALLELFIQNTDTGQGTVLCLDKTQGYGILEQGDEICLEKHDRRQKVVFIM